MTYWVQYKDPTRNWGQMTLGDFCPGLDEIHEQFLDAFEKGKYLMKKRRYDELKVKGYQDLGILRRGRGKKCYPSKKIFNMDNARDVAEVKRFKWFTYCWHQVRIPESNAPTTRLRPLEFYLPTVFISETRGLKGKAPRITVPQFRQVPIVGKDEYCTAMADWAWAACHRTVHRDGQLCHIFYLNSFDFFDDLDFMSQIKWGNRKAFLPSDLIKIELFRLLRGWDRYNQFAMLFEENAYIYDNLAIPENHRFPAGHRYTKYLQQIGLNRVQEFFDNLVNEARKLGIIQDRVHIWDGQFHETWLQTQNPRKRSNLPKPFNGVYNHGGKKVGVGIVQSTIMDWNGICAIPIHTEVFPANQNENPIVRTTIEHAYRNRHQKVPQYFLADRGPSGHYTQSSIAGLGTIPIIPLTEKSKKDVRITKNKGHRFYQSFFEFSTDEDLENAYALRTHIEEQYSFYDVQFSLGSLHAESELLLRITLILANCLAILVPLTAYKIGRPDLMWAPTAFQANTVHPELIFPLHYRALCEMRFDAEIAPSPLTFKREIAKLRKDQSANA